VKTQPTRVASRNKRVVEVSLAMGGPEKSGTRHTYCYSDSYSYISLRTMLSILCFIVTLSVRHQILLC
jgi:hypothetical protein